MSNSRTDWWPPMDDAAESASPWPDEASTTPEPAARPQHRSRSRQREREVQQRKHARRRSVLVVLVVLAMLAGSGYILMSVFGGGGEPAVATVEDFPGPGHPSAQVVISAGDTGADMAKTLVDAGVVATTKAFINAFAANPDAAKIQPGTYNLLLQMPAADAVVALLNPASRVSMRVTIPEGRTKAQIVAKINEVTQIPVADLDAALADPAAIGLPAEAGGNAEGWLFPTTYQVEPGASAASVLTQMTAKTVALLTAKGVPNDQWKAVLTKASLIEREAKRDADRPMMARVIENRLAKNWPLEIDSTSAYGLGKSGMDLTAADLHNAADPYSTYAHAGLPPTPIAAPGEKSIDAVLAPADGPWMFWCTVNLDTGETVFSTTLQEHNDAVAQLNAWIADNATATAEP